MASLGSITRVTVPHPWLLAPFEGPRATAEALSLLPSAPWLLATSAVAGHPVLAVPGLSGGNAWTVVLRRFLAIKGYAVHTPDKGTMRGAHATVVARLADRVSELASEAGQPVSIIGWSVGGAFTRQVALAQPESVRSLITLGAPLSGSWYPEGSAAGGPLPVPTTAIYSRTDGTFDWRRCVQRPGPMTENVEIVSSHLGMATNPMTVHVVADRLGQADGRWRPYHSAWHLGEDDR
ncbi:MAG TPA: hypothetical protein PLZ83_00765 [Dermatophilaceae bacterium]|jgi:pimeloyl-ACP methyl ester carboxylesterase|nr:hypothetical protein [Dermatophilaceae bacterium]HOF35331.1 hypothetical protein [Dermatophilaceae bacterium]HOI03271.1 hypothetical protein [Dermatophilaceae bacterium]HOR14188.1 hypothetical protein [Dermatophilaceae bacterium]HOU99665.1 hypothetical protein [Dermatophilaceae bacterium]